MVTHSLDNGQQPIDLKKLEKLGAMVWSEGGGEEILRLVEEAKKGVVPRTRQNACRSDSMPAPSRRKV